MPRTAALIPAVAIAALLMSGCTPQPVPAPSDEPTVSATPTPTQTEEPALVLPADAVLGLTLRATADTGAQVDVLLVLLKPEAWDTANGTTRAAATVAWCDGEVDQGVITAESGFSFAQLDATVTQVAGTPAWPADLPLHLLPGGGGPTLAAGGSAYSVQAPDDSGSDEGGYYIPHCLQDVFVPAPGTGSAYLGFGNDGTTLGAWVSSYYGATFDLFGEPVGDPRATLDDCTKFITDLGTSMGATDSSLPDFFSATQCRVGDPA